MSEQLPLLERAGRRFARFAHDVVVAQPWLWRVFRRPVQAQFDRLARVWESRRDPEASVLGPALDRVGAPGKILDLGTGTGIGARALASRFPAAEIVGVDLAPAMIAEAKKLLPEDLAGRVRFEVADASALPFADGEFDLVVLLNMIPFFGELARVTAPVGAIVFGFSSGPETPIFTPTERLRSGLAPHGFTTFEELGAGDGTAVLARRDARG
jgi:SAM-dependent methyltransferase